MYESLLCYWSARTRVDLTEQTKSTELYCLNGFAVKIRYTACLLKKSVMELTTQTVLGKTEHLNSQQVF